MLALRHLTGAAKDLGVTLGIIIVSCIYDITQVGRDEVATEPVNHAGVRVGSLDG